MWEAHGPTLEDDMEFETDVIGNTNEIVYTNKRLIQQDHESLFSREVPAHLQSHFRFDNFGGDCDESLEAPDEVFLK
jgi:hypothetical protein